MSPDKTESVRLGFPDAETVGASVINGPTLGFTFCPRNQMRGYNAPEAKRAAEMAEKGKRRINRTLNSKAQQGKVFEKWKLIIRAKLPSL